MSYRIPIVFIRGIVSGCGIGIGYGVLWMKVWMRRLHWRWRSAGPTGSSMFCFLKYSITLLSHDIIFLTLHTFDFVILFLLWEGPLLLSNTIVAIAEALLSATAFFFLYAIRAFFNDDMKLSSSLLLSRFLAATA